MTPAEELELADLSPTKEIETINGRRTVRREDGSVFFLDQLSEVAYWAYMSKRERAWYDRPSGG